MRLICSLILCLLAWASPAAAQLITLSGPSNDSLVYYEQLLALDNLVAFYDLGDAIVGGGAVVDAVGSADGLIAGAANLTSVAGAAAATGNAIEFGGGVNRITDMYTLDCDADWSLILDFEPASTGDGPLISCGTARKLIDYDGTGGGVFINWSGTPQAFSYAVPEDEWTSMGLRYDHSASELILYADGLAVDTVTVSAGVWAGDLALGVNNSGTDFLVDVKLDGFAVFDAAIDPDVFRQHYIHRQGAYEYATVSAPALVRPFGVQTKLTTDADYALNVAKFVKDTDYLIGDLTVVLETNTGAGHCSIVSSHFVGFSPSVGEYTPDDGAGCEVSVTNPRGEEWRGFIALNFRGDGDFASVPTVADQPALLALATSWPADSLGALRLRQTYYPGTTGDGLIFSYTEDALSEIIPRFRFPAGTSTAKSETTTIGRDEGLGYETACAPIVPGSVRIALSGTDFGSTAYSETLADSMLTGVRFMSSVPWVPEVDYREGSVTLTPNHAQQFRRMIADSAPNGDWSLTADIDYDCADDTRLWEAFADAEGTRLDSLTVWPARWFGALDSTQADWFDNRDILNQAHYAALRHNAKPERFISDYVTQIKLTDLTCARYGGTQCEGVFFWWSQGVLQQAPHVFTSGEIGVVEVDSTFNTTTEGFTTGAGDDITYTTVVVTDSSTVLKMMPPPTAGCDRCRDVFDVYQTNLAYSDTMYVVPDAFMLTAGLGPVLQADHLSASFNAIKHLVLDGNLQLHKERIYASGDYPQTWHTSNVGDSNVLQNAPIYAGIALTEHGGHGVSDKGRLRIDSSAVQNFGATTLLIGGGGTIPRSTEHYLNNVLLGSSGSGHGGYFFDSVIAKNLRVTGGSWGHLVTHSLEVDGFVLDGLHKGVRAAFEPEFIQIRSSEPVAYDSVAAVFLNAEGQAGYNGPNIFRNVFINTRGAHAPPPEGGFSADGNKAVLMNQGNVNTILDNAVWMQDTTYATALYRSRNNDIAKSIRWSGSEFTDLTIYEQPVDNGTETWMGQNSWDQTFTERVRWIGDTAGTDFEHCLYLAPRRSGQNGGTAPMWNVWRHLGNEGGVGGRPMSCNRLLRFDLSSDNDVGGGVSRHFILGSEFKNTSGTLADAGPSYPKLSDVCDVDGSGVTLWPDTPCARIENMSIYMDSVTFRVNEDFLSNQHLLAATARLNNVTSAGEDDEVLTESYSGTYTCVSNETTFTIDPSLVWTPHPTLGTVSVSGPVAVDSYTFPIGTNDDSSIRSVNKPIVDPDFRVVLQSTCTAGQEFTIEIEVAPWEGGVTVPTETAAIAASGSIMGGTWRWVPVAGMECRDGSQEAGYLIREASGATEAVIWMQGGGAGWDGGTYHATPLYQNFETMAEFLPGRQAAGGGWFDFSNPANPFVDKTMVVIPYCTGDIHSGTNTDYVTGYNTQGGLYPRVGVQQHVGYNNVAAVLTALESEANYADWTKYFLTGSSAGACGVYGNYTQVATWASPAVVDAVIDACPLVEDDAVLKPETQQAWHDVWQLAAIPGCPTGDVSGSCKRTNGDGLENIMSHLATTYPSADFYYTGHLYETVFSNFFAHDDDCEKACEAVDIESLRTATLDWVDGFPANVYTFLLDQPGHTVMQNGKAYSEEIGGKSALEWLGDLLSDAPASGLATPAASPTTTPTYDGNGQSTHPDVLDMAWELAERGAGGTTWNGYRYWMAHTPYPFADGSKENPSILVSNTGLDGSWGLPTGGPDPVYPKPAQGIQSDVEITLNATADTLFMHYRQQQFNGLDSTRVRVGYTTDGVTWSTAEIAEKAVGSGLLTFDGGYGENRDHLSPDIVWNKTDDRFEMYAIGRGPGGDRSLNVLVRRTADYLGGPWSALDTTLTMTGLPEADGQYMWHIDVRRDSVAGGHEYRAVVPLWSAQSTSGTDNADLYYCDSTDGLAFACEVLLGFDSSIAWTADGYYRGSLVPTGTAGDIPTGYKLWYGGISVLNEWRIGETSWTLP